MVPSGHAAGGTAVGGIVWAIVQATLKYGNAVPGSLMQKRGSAKLPGSLFDPRACGNRR